MAHRVQVGAGGGQPAAAVEVAVEAREPLLPVAVHVVGQRVAGLLDGLEEGPEQRVLGRASLQDERPVAAAPLVGARQAGLHPLEVGQAVQVVPRLHARLGGPALVVQRVAALEDHPVDAAGAAEHLAAGVVDAAAVHVRLGVGLVASSRRTGCRSGTVSAAGMWMNGSMRKSERPASRTSTRGAAVRRQPVGQSAAGGSAADDHHVVASVIGSPVAVGCRRRQRRAAEPALLGGSDVVPDVLGLAVLRQAGLRPSSRPTPDCL